MHVLSLRLSSLFAVLAMLVFATGIALADQDAKFDMSEFKFNPGAATLRSGEKINFTLVNSGRFPHNLHIAGPGGEVNVASANVAPGATATGSYTFTAPGTYTFWCPVGNHRSQGMEGTFTVSGAGAAGAATLPRTGGLPFDFVGGGLAGLAAISFAGGLILRRRA